MGVDAKWGRFPICPRNVPFCPRLSSFVLLGAPHGDKSGQKRTNGDKTGHFGTNWETPPFSIYPHLALLNMWPLENGQKGSNKKHVDRFRTFRLFLLLLEKSKMGA